MQQLQTTNYKLQTISAWLQENTANLQRCAIESARLDCLLLLEFVLEKPRDWILAHDDDLLTDAQTAKLASYVQQRADRTPLAYIIGSKEFYGRTFLVTKDTLIPRPESEAIMTLLRNLVDSGQRTARPTSNVQPPTIYDIGTGSGILAITAKLEIPTATVIATDISTEALSVAKKNAKNLGADVIFKTANLLPTTHYPLPTTILANLPYVPRDMITSPEILKEPDKALFSGDDGLDHYREFWQRISQLNNKPVAVLTESLASQHADLAKLARGTGYCLQETSDLIQLFTPRAES